MNIRSASENILSFIAHSKYNKNPPSELPPKASLKRFVCRGRWKTIATRCRARDQYWDRDFEMFHDSLQLDPILFQFFTIFLEFEGKTDLYKLYVELNASRANEDQDSTDEVDALLGIALESSKNMGLLNLLEADPKTGLIVSNDILYEKLLGYFSTYVFPCFLHSKHYSSMLVNAESSVYNAPKDDSVRRTVIHHAIHNKNRIEFDYFVLTHRMPILVTDSEGNTPLHYACCSSDPYFVKILCEMAPDAGKQNDNGQTPLHCASINEGDILAQFLEYNPVYNISDNTGRLPIDSSAPKNRSMILSHIRKVIGERIDSRFCFTGPFVPLRYENVFKVGREDMEKSKTDLFLSFNNVVLRSDNCELSLNKVDALDRFIGVLSQQLSIEEDIAKASGPKLRKQHLKEHKKIISQLTALRTDLSRNATKSDRIVEEFIKLSLNFLVSHVVGRDRVDYFYMSIYK